MSIQISTECSVAYWGNDATAEWNINQYWNTHSKWSWQTKRSKPKAVLHGKCKHQYSTIPKLAKASTYYTLLCQKKKQPPMHSTSTITAGTFNSCLTGQCFQTYFSLGQVPKKWHFGSCWCSSFNWLDQTTVSKHWQVC